MPQNISIIKDILQEHYLVKVATNGQVALKVAQKEPLPDLVLLDIMMPGMDGYQVCKQLRENPLTRDIPIIFVSAMGEVRDEVKGLELGAVDYIIKPVSAPILLARVNTQMALKRAQQAVRRQYHLLREERMVVENIVKRMRRSRDFDDRYLRYQVAPVEATNGDIVLSAFRADGSQQLLVGDFTGHGLPAAVGGPLVTYIFYRSAREGRPFQEALEQIDQMLIEQLPVQVFMACGAVEISADRTQARVWSMGLPPLVRFDPQGALTTMESVRPPLGIDDREAFPEGDLLEWSPQDRLYLYSDGLIELENAADEPYGQARLVEKLSHIAKEGHQLMRLFDDLRRFVGQGEPFQDDMTLVELAG
ncbi:putative response regulator receiver protein [Magnetofaba australis IT-1]|uniref:Putative response regulator receiver protein n=2 Tax=Magnetofaba TaxID=1472292 RepID=A0A1Y2K2G8_9PROT|nr:putative response regulator receiver protein [Magnetofaba australis IT-1]